MEQAKDVQNKNSLLHYAISKLTPDVFTHPVWIRFGNRETSDDLTTANSLFKAVKNSQLEDPGTACQVLLLCAFLQNRAGQQSEALRAVRQAITLSQDNYLSKEEIWALWANCAIFLQQGNYEQACLGLTDLQALLSKQNEWILAGFVDVFRQTFHRSSGSSQDQAFQDTLSFTLNWLMHWGISTQELEAGFASSYAPPTNDPFGQTASFSAFSPIQKLQGRWHSLILAMRGELHLQWKEIESHSDQGKLSLWGVLLSSIRFNFTGRRTDFAAEENIAPPITMALPAPPQEPLALVIEAAGSTIDQSIPTTGKDLTEKIPTFIPVTVNMLGTFSMSIGDQTVRMPASRSASLLKYLLIHHKQTIPREILMELFWPDAEPETARNNLNVAIHSLRKVLRKLIDIPVICFEAGAYGFESNLRIWLDVEEFENAAQAGQRLESRKQVSAAVTEYETAISLYQSDFLEQDPYEEWTILDRERLRIIYLDILDHLSQIYFNQEHYAPCLITCKLILSRDHCREDAHSLAMRCYSRQGKHYLALRQYQMCVESLRTELDTEPEPATTQLAERIRNHERV